MKPSRRKFLGGSALATLTALLPERVKAWFPHGSTSVAAPWVPGNVPFSPTSAANNPIPSGTPIQPMIWPVSTGSNYFVGTKAYIDIPNLATAPTVTFTANGNLGWPAGTYTRPMTSGCNGANSLSGQAGADNEVISIIGSNYEDMWEFFRHSDTTAGGPGGPIGALGGCDILADDGFGTSVKAAGVVAAKSAVLLGSILKEEYVLGGFSHMLSCSPFSTLVNAGHPILPVFGNDGLSTSGICVQGNILTFPPAMSAPAGLSAIGIAIFNAVKTYGCIVVDNGGSTGFLICQVFDASQPGSSIPFSASTSWNTTDYGHMISDTAILFPLMWKTGFIMDGFAGPGGPCGTLVNAYGPQTKFNGHLAQTLMVVTRDSDSTSSNITSDGTVKGLLNSTALSTFCSGTTGRATQLGNQIGLANFISGGAAVPIIYQSGAIENLNGIPAPKFNGTSNFYAMAGSSGNWPGTTVYFNAVFQVDDLLADYYIFGSDVSGGLALKIAATTGIPTLCTNTGTLIGQPFASIAAGSVYEIGVRHTAGATWSMQLNGSAAGSGTTAVSATAGNILLGQAGPTATGFFKGHIPDAMVTSSMANSPQYSIENGLALFYATLGTVTKIHNTVVSDTFTDTNGTDLASHTMNVGTGWTDLSGTHFIQSNAAQPNTLVSGKAFATFIPLSAGATGSPISDGVYTLSMTPTGILNNEFLPGMVLRISNTTNYLIFQLDGVAGTARLSSVVAGVSTSLGVSTVTIVAGTSYSCVITLFGPNITFAVNAETPIAVVSSVNQTIAKFGIRSSEIGTASACVFDTLTFTT